MAAPLLYVAPLECCDSMNSSNKASKITGPTLSGIDSAIVSARTLGKEHFQRKTKGGELRGGENIP